MLSSGRWYHGICPLVATPGVAGGGPRPLCPHPRYPNACMRPVYAMGRSLVHMPSHTAELAPTAPWCCVRSALVLAMPAPCPICGPRCSGSGVRFEGRPRNRAPLTTRPQPCTSKAPAGAPPLYVDAVCDGCAPARPTPSGVAPTAPAPRAPGPPWRDRPPSPTPLPPLVGWPPVHRYQLQTNEGGTRVPPMTRASVVALGRMVLNRTGFAGECFS